MVRTRLLISALCTLMIVQGCIHGDLDDCPPMVNYAVAFTYTDHIWNSDRFTDDVKKINLYVFRHDGIDIDTIYRIKTQMGRFDKTFKIPLDELPVGTYDMVAWGNVLDDQPFHITPDEFLLDTTSLTQARLILEKTRGELNDTELEKLFWGEITAEIPLHISRVDTIPLHNDTKRIRVVIHWDYNNLPALDLDNVVVRINGTNAKYRFHNDREAQNVTYAPYHAPYDSQQTDSILQLSDDNWIRLNYFDRQGKFQNESETSVFDFTVLRIFKDVPMQLSIEYHHPQGNAETLAEFDITNSQQGFPVLFQDTQWRSLSRFVTSDEQPMFDHYDYYRLDIHLFHEGFLTFTTTEVSIRDWWSVYYGVGGGAN